VRTRRVEGQAALVDALQKQELYRARHRAYAAFTAADGLPADLDIHWWSGRDAPASAYEIDAQACADAALTDCVELRARPGTARVDGRFRDPDCGALTLDSRGRQGATGPAARCWP
jgi:type IV pilus assembly protein PilE